MKWWCYHELRLKFTNSSHMRAHILFLLIIALVSALKYPERPQGEAVVKDVVSLCGMGARRDDEHRANTREVLESLIRYHREERPFPIILSQMPQLILRWRILYNLFTFVRPLSQTFSNFSMMIFSYVEKVVDILKKVDSTVPKKNLEEFQLSQHTLLQVRSYWYFYHFVEKIAYLRMRTGLAFQPNL